MQKITLIFTLVFLFLISANAQKQTLQPTEVLTLGVFHFNFPNLDAQKILKSDQIDVLDQKHQDEINTVVDKLSAFKPTIIVIERQSNRQEEVDSLYNLYLQGKYILGRSEQEQIGFRLARKMGLKQLYCVDEWGKFYPEIERVVMGSDSMELVKFIDYYDNNDDRDKAFKYEPVFKTKGILEELERLNNQDNIKKSLGNYLIESFKYESQEGDFFGVDFETNRWFNRNLRIFRNLQRINTEPSDKILVIFGSGHMNLLNIFFDSSPEYRLVNTNDFLFGKK